MITRRPCAFALRNARTQARLKVDIPSAASKNSHESISPSSPANSVTGSVRPLLSLHVSISMSKPVMRRAYSIGTFKNSGSCRRLG